MAHSHFAHRWVAHEAWRELDSYRGAATQTTTTVTATSKAHHLDLDPRSPLLRLRSCAYLDPHSTMPPSPTVQGAAQCSVRSGSQQPCPKFLRLTSRTVAAVVQRSAAQLC